MLVYNRVDVCFLFDLKQRKIKGVTAPFSFLFFFFISKLLPVYSVTDDRGTYCSLFYCLVDKAALNAGGSIPLTLRTFIIRVNAL